MTPPDYVKSLLWDIAVNVALDEAKAALIANLPVFGAFLTSGPIWAVIVFVVKLFTDKLYDQTKLFVNYEIITIKNAEHLKTYTSAVTKLKILAHDKGADSDEFKQAREASLKALSVFAHRSFGDAA